MRGSFHLRFLDFWGMCFCLYIGNNVTYCMLRFLDRKWREAMVHVKYVAHMTFKLVERREGWFWDLWWYDGLLGSR